MNNESLIKKVVRISVIAAMYVALTLALSFMSYGGIQYRVAEILVLLCFFRKDYAISMIIGCAIANAFSPLGLIDVAMGTLATAIAVTGIMFSKRLIVAGLFPVVANALIVAWELQIVFKEPFWFSALTVGFGEAVVILVGVIIFMLLRQNEKFLTLIKANQNLPKDVTSND